METMGLYSLLYLILYSPFIISLSNAAFTEIPKDVSVGEGEDVEMPCAFKTVSSALMSLEIQWWYLKVDVPKELPHELQISAPSNRAKVLPREATKISMVRVRGNAISHRLSLSKVKKEDEGMYECRVSDLWAADNEKFTAHAMLNVTLGDGMVAEEAVSHIQSCWPLINNNPGLGGSAAGRITSEPSQGLAGGQRMGQGKHQVPQQAQSGLFPFIASINTSVAKSSASPLLRNAAILQQKLGAGCSVMSTMDPLLCIILPFLLAR